MPAPLAADEVGDDVEVEVGVVLAGGRSARIGRDKAFLRIGGVPLFQRVLNKLARILSDLYIVTNRPDDFCGEMLAPAAANAGASAGVSVRVIAEPPPGVGPLGGLVAALEALRESRGGASRALVVGCDMPFLDVGVLESLLAASRRSPDADVHVPLWSLGLEPLHAVYSGRSLEAARAVLREGRRRMVAFYPSVTVEYMRVEKLFGPALLERAFFNINTPAQLEKARADCERSSRQW